MLKRIIILTLKGYKLFISPYQGQNCKFYPTCSNYSIEAVKNFGLLIGLKLTIIRLLKCNPWNEGGIQCLPEKNVKNKN